MTFYCTIDKVDFRSHKLHKKILEIYLITKKNNTEIEINFLVLRKDRVIFYFKKYSTSAILENTYTSIWENLLSKHKKHLIFMPFHATKSLCIAICQY